MILYIYFTNVFSKAFVISLTLYFIIDSDIIFVLNLKERSRIIDNYVFL